VRIPSAESLRVPEEGSSTQGKPGPKPRPKGVGDGRLVKIPVPPKTDISEVVTQEGKLSDGWKSLFKRVGKPAGKTAGGVSET
jgi:hypothetical protein